MVSNKIVILVVLVGFAVAFQITWAAPNVPESYLRDPALTNATVVPPNSRRARWGPQDKGAGEECTPFAGQCGQSGNSELFCAPCITAACEGKSFICQ